MLRVFRKTPKTVGTSPVTEPLSASPGLEGGAGANLKVLSADAGAAAVAGSPSIPVPKR